MLDIVIVVIVGDDRRGHSPWLRTPVRKDFSMAVQNLPLGSSALLLPTGRPFPMTEYGSDQRIYTESGVPLSRLEGFFISAVGVAELARVEAPDAVLEGASTGDALELTGELRMTVTAVRRRVGERLEATGELRSTITGVTGARSLGRAAELVEAITDAS